VAKVTLSEERQENAKNEAELLENLKGCPHIPEFLEFETDESLNTSLLLMKEEEGFSQNVWDLVSETTLTEEEAKRVMKQLGASVLHLH